MRIMRWLRERWNSMLPDRAYILGVFNVEVNGLPLVAGVAHRHQLNSRGPVSSGYWKAHWRWVSEPMVGVTLEHPDSTYIVVDIKADAPVARGEIEVVYRREEDGTEVRSKPTFISLYADPAITSADV